MTFAEERLVWDAINAFCDKLERLESANAATDNAEIEAAVSSLEPAEH